MRTSCSRIAAVAFLLVAAGIAAPSHAASGQGLSVSVATGTSEWSPWQGRIAYVSPSPVWRSGLGGFESGGFAVKQGRRGTSLNLLGDYFFAPSLAPSGGAGGLRATTGIIIGTRTQLSLSQQGLPAGLFGSNTRVFGSSPPYAADAAAEPATLPYVGVGYTGLAAAAGWSFSADLGLVGGGTSNAASRLFGSGTRSLDDSTRDLRLMPLLQIGVQYSF